MRTLKCLLIDLQSGVKVIITPFLSTGPLITGKRYKTCIVPFFLEPVSLYKHFEDNKQKNFPFSLRLIQFFIGQLYILIPPSFYGQQFLGVSYLSQLILKTLFFGIKFFCINFIYQFFIPTEQRLALEEIIDKFNFTTKIGVITLAAEIRVF